MVQRTVLVAAALVERGHGAVQRVPAIRSCAAQLRAQEVAEQPVIAVVPAVERLRQHVAARQIREQLRRIGASRDLVARIGFQIVEHRGREHETEGVDGQRADHFGIEVLRELGRLTAQAAERCAPAAPEHTGERDGRDQAFGPLQQQRPLRGVARDPQRGEHVSRLFVIAAEVVARDLVQLTVQPQAGERRKRRHRPTDEDQVEPSRTVEAQLVEIPGRDRIGELVDAVAHHDGRAFEVAEGGDPSLRVGGRGVPAGAGPVGEHAGPQAVGPVIAAVEREPHHVRGN